MYRQDEGRNGTGTVRLVRAGVGDGRVRRNLENERSERQRRRMAALFLLSMAVLLVFAGVFRLAERFLEEDVRGSGADSVKRRIIRPDQQISGEGAAVSEDMDEEDGAEPESAADAEEIPEPEDEPLPHAPRIAIDPGHGGENGGCEGTDMLEKDVNLELALLLERKLRERGYETALTREDDTALTLEERVRRAREAGAELYISIHQNFYDGKGADSVSGVETWYCGSSEGSRRLAQLVQKGTVEKTGAKDRGIKETEELYVIREAAMPACLIETGFLSSSGESLSLASPEYREKIAEGIAQGVDLYYHPKTMYLTFDDGPSAENTAAVLDILKEHDIKATFFLVGENVENHPDMARRIVEEGHSVGVHCYRHDYTQLYQSVDAYLEDFQKAYDVILEVTGVEAQMFRFPGGSVNTYNREVCGDIVKAMTEKGYIYFDWNASLEDAARRTTPEQLVESGVSSARGRARVVMLCHDIIRNTSQCLESLIDSLPEYRMEPLSPEVKPIRFRLP